MICYHQICFLTASNRSGPSFFFTFWYPSYVVVIIWEPLKTLCMQDEVKWLSLIVKGHKLKLLHPGPHISKRKQLLIISVQWPDFKIFYFGIWFLFLNPNFQTFNYLFSRGKFTPSESVGKLFCSRRLYWYFQLVKTPPLEKDRIIGAIKVSFTKI